MLRFEASALWPFVKFIWCCSLRWVYNMKFALSKVYFIRYLQRISSGRPIHCLTGVSHKLIGNESPFLEKQDQFTFMTSEKITENLDLLQLLETSYNVLIYERRLSDSGARDPLSKTILQPDVMIDERTCIQLQDLLPLAGAGAQNAAEELRDTVLALSFKCHKCYIILQCTPQSE